jgi:hypothetical protein
MQKEEFREVPRFPLPKEKIKFQFADQEKVFAVRDLSLKGLGISLLEFGDSLFFVEGEIYQAELRLESAPNSVRLRCSRLSAWSVGFEFADLTDELRGRIQELISPLHIGSSLKKVDRTGAPEAFLQGMTAWYHGDSGSDLFFWGSSRGGVDRALFCLGQKFWEWREESGISTGEMRRQEGETVALHRDTTPDPKTREFVRKVLEHADALDYRLVTFLREKT